MLEGTGWNSSVTKLPGYNWDSSVASILTGRKPSVRGVHFGKEGCIGALVHNIQRTVVRVTKTITQSIHEHALLIQKLPTGGHSGRSRDMPGC